MPFTYKKITLEHKIQTAIAEYELLKELGAGGFASVFLAKVLRVSDDTSQLKTNQLVAIKVQKTSDLSQNECNVLEQVQKIDEGFLKYYDSYNFEVTYTSMVRTKLGETKRIENHQELSLIVSQYLGSSLWELYDPFDNDFTIYSACQIGI